MKSQITLDAKEAEHLMVDLEGWAQVLESEGDGGHPWIEEMQAHARMIRDKLAGRTE